MREKCLKSKPKDILKRPAAKAKGKSASKKAKPSQKPAAEQEEDESEAGDSEDVLEARDLEAAAPVLTRPPSASDMGTANAADAAFHAIPEEEEIVR